jgi:two-component system, chemotaxis family, protein-glutamate methylesterase/glutaminase
MANPDRIIVIGASAGGYQPVVELISKLPAEINAAVFVVLHMTRLSLGNMFLQRIQEKTKLTCVIPKDQTEIKRGHVYIAAPDFHMMVKDTSISISKGPYENRWRPSIDALLRSAAASHTNKVIGVILSGLLDDGTSGMAAIKRTGGITIVQEPKEAEFSDMPNNVINNVEVDYRVTLADIPYVIADLLAQSSLPEEKEIPLDVKIEAEIAERALINIDNLKEIAEQSLFVCPDCGGGLWAIKGDNVHRYRCHTGHVYTEKILLEKQGEALEESLWISIRMLEERRNLLMTVAEHERERFPQEAVDKHVRSEELRTHIERLKNMLSLISAEADEDLKNTKE